jgi:cell cycle sensor histidine kinase DivJ
MKAALAGASGAFTILALLALAAAAAPSLSAPLLGAAHGSLLLVLATGNAITALALVQLAVLRIEPGRRQVPGARLTGETALDLMVTFDAAGAAKSVGGNCQNLLGLSPRELNGRGFFERVHVADRPIFLKAVTDAGFGLAIARANLRLRANAVVDRGRYAEPIFVWLDMLAQGCDGGASAAGKQGHSEAREVVCVFRDVTQSKAREDELEAARASAEEASQSKDHFLANVSHELRTPLNAILGFSELLSHPELAPRDAGKRLEYAGVIHQSGQHLLTVVNSILDLSKIRSGSFDIRPERFCIAPMFDLCCDMIKLDAAEKGVEVVREYAARLGEVIGDKRACKQIIINLLSNALKFTPPRGRVTVGANADGNSFLLTVADTGIGIEPGDLDRLGDPFFQAKASRDRPFEGTGLGLSIVRGLVGLHGGEIAVASEPGKGTCVVVRLPLDCREQLTEARPCASIAAISGDRRGDEQHDLFKQTLDELSKQARVKKIA